MSSCTCTDATEATVSFQNGTVLLRCADHDRSRWLVDGQEVPTAVAFSRLREHFHAERLQPQRHKTPRRQVVLLPQPRAVEPYEVRATPVTAPSDEELTALLQAHGVSGSWAVA